jgi:hypothetical protein
LVLKLRIVLDVWFQFFVRSLKYEGVCFQAVLVPASPDLLKKSQVTGADTAATHGIYMKELH